MKVKIEKQRAKIDIIYNERTITQKLDYLNVPFCCNACHEMGNLRSLCPSLLHGHLWRRASPVSYPASSISNEAQTVLFTKGIYNSSSPSTYQDITKGDLLFLEDVENFASLNPSNVNNIGV